MAAKNASMFLKTHRLTFSTRPNAQWGSYNQKSLFTGASERAGKYLHVSQNFIKLQFLSHLLSVMN